MAKLKKEDPFEDKSRLLDRAAEDSDAQNKAGHERTEALRKQLDLMLVQTRKAMTKIKVGKYGICESCGKMIDTDRLAAMPTATLCLTCEKKREK
ncbi:MAG: TraR/DksA C4-type zinc finger protein [Patescibacteria group bacterium]|nr:TraR/DksA C4-type zinc finger protein [Patescibacteria group bacterium]MCL5432129.1 TraR/DksA C4-type zinc finger protein [Patescibacteria group bacterium]